MLRGWRGMSMWLPQTLTAVAFRGPPGRRAAKLFLEARTVHLPDVPGALPCARRGGSYVANNDALRLAVLIDADNASAAVAKELLEEVVKYGTATIKRAYGDWTTPNLGGWKDHRMRPAKSS
jgi:hypothetical protein